MVCPISTASTATDDTSSYHTTSNNALTASTPTAHTRRTSTTSTVSVHTGGGGSNTGSSVNECTRRISGASVSSVVSNARSVRSMTRATTVKCVAPSIPTADPMKLSPASAAITPMVKSRPVSTHSTASTVSSTPQKVIIVGTLGRDGKEPKESMLNPCPVELPAQPLPP